MNTFSYTCVYLQCIFTIIYFLLKREQFLKALTVYYVKKI